MRKSGFRDWARHKKFLEYSFSNPGQTSGISISYFFMLAGTEDLIKPDRMIGRFLKRHLGYEPSPAEAQSLIFGACEILRAQYPHLTPRLLDYVIWSHERAREKK